MQRYLKSLYDVHSWLGLGLGLILYAVCFSGLAALFLDELNAWHRGSIGNGQASDTADIDVLVRQLLQQQRDAVDGHAAYNVRLHLPDAYRPFVEVSVRSADEEVGETRWIDPVTREELAQDEVHFVHWMERLHTDLLLPSPFGRYLLGALGVIMLVLIVTGTLQHRKRWKELFTFRPDRSARVRWGDLHKLIGIWGLPFHFVISLTGAILGFTGMVLLPAAFISFEGDIESALEEISGIPAGIVSPVEDMLPLGAYLEKSQEAVPGLIPRRVQFAFEGDSITRVVVMGDLEDALVFLPSVTLDGAGNLLKTANWSAEGPVKQIYAMIAPLHYAVFGGLTTKLLYALMGAGLCYIIYTGLAIWLGRPTQEGREKSTGAFRGALVVAVFGLHAAAALTLLVETAGGGYLSAEVVLAVFLGSWLATVLLPVLVGRRLAKRALNVILAVSLGALPLADGRIFGWVPGLGMPGQPTVTWVVDFVFVGVALALLAFHLMSLAKPRLQKD